MYLYFYCQNSFYHKSSFEIVAVVSRNGIKCCFSYSHCCIIIDFDIIELYMMQVICGFLIIGQSKALKAS